MLAAVLKEIDAPLEVCEVGLTELNYGQVLVQMLVSGICGSQLLEIKGFKGNSKFLPHLLGHEGCGIVTAIGPGVTKVAPGDKVVLHWRVGTGIESPFPRFTLEGKEISSGRITTFSEETIVSENRVTRIPSDTDPELAAMLGCSMSTSLALIENQSNLKFGESVLITGSGGVGLNLILAARARGAARISVFDNKAEKSQLAVDNGATDFHTSIDDIANVFDVAIDTTGDPNVIGRIFEMMSSSGRIFLVGQPDPKKSLEIPNAVQLFNGSGIQMRATQAGGFNPESDISRYLEYMKNKENASINLVTHRFKLDTINEAIEKLRSGTAGRIMITFEKK